MTDLTKVTITVAGKEYAFLKPYPIYMVELERQSFKDGKYSAISYENALLKMVSKDIKKDDLVKFVGKPLTLSSGVVLTPAQIPFEQYEKMIVTVHDDNIITTVQNFLSICGNSVVDLNKLTKEDVYEILDAYTGLYDRTELDDVLTKLTSFC